MARLAALLASSKWPKSAMMMLSQTVSNKVASPLRTTSAVCGDASSEVSVHQTKDAQMVNIS